MAGGIEVLRRTSRAAAITLAVMAAGTVALGVSGPMARSFVIFPAVLGLFCLVALLYTMWRPWEAAQLWRVRGVLRIGPGEGYQLAPLGAGLGVTLFVLFMALVARLGLSFKIAWLSVGLTPLLCLVFMLPMAVRHARHLLPLLWGRPADAASPTELRVAVRVWLAEIGVNTVFVGLVCLGVVLTAVNPALTWYATDLRVVKATESPAAAGGTCALRLGLLPGFLVVDVDRSPLATRGWVGEEGELLEPLPASPAPPSTAGAEEISGRCYLRLSCGDELVVGGFDAGGFDCALEIDSESRSLCGVFGGDGDDTDGDPGWRFSGDLFRVFEGDRQIEGWLVLR